MKLIVPLNLCFIFQPDLHPEIFLLTGNNSSKFSMTQLIILVVFSFPSLNNEHNIYYLIHRNQILTSHSSTTASKGDTATEFWTPTPRKHRKSKLFIVYCMCSCSLLFIIRNQLLLYTFPLRTSHMFVIQPF